MPDTESLFKKALGWIENFGTLKALFTAAMAFVVSSGVVSVLPGGWHQPQYGAVFGAALFSSAFVLVLMFRGAKAAYEFMAPRSITVTAHGGRKASLQFSHTGDPTTYKAQGRILSLEGGIANPAPQTFHAELQPGAGENGDFEVTLKDGEFAHVIVADIGISDGGPLGGGGTSFMQVRRGKYNSKTNVPDAGAVVEYSITSPQNAGGIGTRRYRVTRDGKYWDLINIEEL